MDARETFLSVISLTEMRSGIEVLPKGRRKSAIASWFEQTVVPHFEDRLLPVTREIAEVCGTMIAQSKQAGFTPDHFDLLIASTAEVHRMTLVTLNQRHFAHLPLRILDLSR